MSTPEFFISPNDTLHDIPGTCHKMGDVSHWTVRSWIKEGRLRPTYAGTRVLVSESEIQRFLKESTEAAQNRPRRVRKSTAK